MDNDLKIIYSVWILTIFLILMLPLISASTKYEWYEGDDGSDNCFANNWVAQSFTVGTVGTDENFEVTSIKFKFYTIGSPTGDVVLSIKEVDGNYKPTGPDLASGAIEASGFTSDPGGAWEEATMETPYELSASTMYAAVITFLDGTAQNHLKVRRDDADATYPGGNYHRSTDSGVNWDIPAGYDFVFEIWGDAVVVDTCTCPGAGEDWEIDMSDYCNITEACDLTTGTLSFTGEGITKCDAVIKTVNLGDPGSSGILEILDDCIIYVS